MQVSIPGLVTYIKSQPWRKPTSQAIWDPCVVADYLNFTLGLDIPQKSFSEEISPFLIELRAEEASLGLIGFVDTLCSPDIPEAYGELPCYMTVLFPKVAQLMQTTALA